MSQQVQQFIVKADPQTGEWLGDPEYVGEVDLAAWNGKADNDAVHFDTYEAPADDGVCTVTRAIEVVWLSV